MFELSWKILCIYFIVNIQVIKAFSASTVAPDTSRFEPSPTDQLIDEQPSDLLPNTTICGKSSRLDEFPWMALIHYEKRNGARQFSCGGFLINERYILTSAVCIKATTMSNLTKIGVRLGEFNLETDPDCIQTVDGVHCAPPPLDIEIEEQIVHEDYDVGGGNNQHDIALLRLQEEIKFTETVRPLCLPTTPKQRSEKYIGARLTVVGWGRTETKKSASVKRRVEVPVQDTEACRSKYKKYKLELSGGQFCAGGELGRDACLGDSGNALMAHNLDENSKGCWYAAGMVSFGQSPCGSEDWPSVYTNISAYMPWILNKLRP